MDLPGAASNLATVVELLIAYREQHAKPRADEDKKFMEWLTEQRYESLVELLNQNGATAVSIKALLSLDRTVVLGALGHIDKTVGDIAAGIENLTAACLASPEKAEYQERVTKAVPHTRIRLAPSRLLQLQFDVGRSTGQWNQAFFEELRSLECQCLRNSDPLWPYVVLAKSHYLLKTGPIRCKEHLRDLAPLVFVTGMRIPESQAAKWTAARIFCAMGAIETSSLARRYKKLARDYFNDIGPSGKLRMPVLLAGALRELPSHLVIDLSAVQCDSLAIAVDRPLRFCSTTELTLAAHDGFRKPDILVLVEKNCHQMYNAIPHAHIPLLNADLCRIMAVVISKRRFDIGPSDSAIIHVIRGAESAIGQMHRGSELSDEKNWEWLAVTAAAQAYLLRAGAEHEDAFNAMKEYLQANIAVFDSGSRRGLPDFILNDPIYRLVSDEREPG